MPVQIETRLAGEQVIVRADKTLFWPAQSTLFAADVHLGKTATFRAGGIAVPEGDTDACLRHLSRSLNETRAENLVFLGDLWHAAAGRTETVTSAFFRWRQAHPTVEMTLVEGNHDRRSGQLPREWNVREVPEDTVSGPFSLCHYPQSSALGYVLSGHLHPAAVLDGVGRQSLSLPCFWVRPDHTVLPAFGPFTGCAAITPTMQDRVFLVAENRVIEAPMPERAARSGRY